jgi:hypothetical protein
MAKKAKKKAARGKGVPRPRPRREGMTFVRLSDKEREAIDWLRGGEPLATFLRGVAVRLAEGAKLAMDAADQSIARYEQAMAEAQAQGRVHEVMGYATRIRSAKQRRDAYLQMARLGRDPRDLATPDQETLDQFNAQAGFVPMGFMGLWPGGGK